MRYQTMDFEQKKKPGSVLRQDTQGTASVQRSAAAPLLAGWMAIQAGLGNRYVQQMVNSIRQGSAALPIQAKLRVGSAQDEYEREADRVAAQIMSMPETAPKAQRLGDKDDDEIQAKPLAATIIPLVSRATVPEEEEEHEELQAKSIGMGDSFEPGTDFESRLASTRGGGKPLPESTREFMEQRFDADFSGVRVHTSGEAAKLNRDLSAQAFTRGSDIFLGEGKENVESNAGRQLLAHELTHVIQQNPNRRNNSPQSRTQSNKAASPLLGKVNACGVISTLNAYVQRAGYREGTWKTEIDLGAYMCSIAAVNYALWKTNRIETSGILFWKSNKIANVDEIEIHDVVVKKGIPVTNIVAIPDDSILGFQKWGKRDRTDGSLLVHFENQNASRVSHTMVKWKGILKGSNNVCIGGTPAFGEVTINDYLENHARFPGFFSRKADPSEIIKIYSHPINEVLNDLGYRR